MCSFRWKVLIHICSSGHCSLTSIQVSAIQDWFVIAVEKIWKQLRKKKMSCRRAKNTFRWGNYCRPKITWRNKNLRHKVSFNYLDFISSEEVSYC